MHVTFTIPAKKEEVPPIRTAVYNLAITSGQSQPVAFHASVIADELCNNAIEHGSKKGSKVTLDYRIEKNQIQITCEDEGGKIRVKPEEILKHLTESKTESTSMRGRGISKLVKSYAHSVSAETSKRGGIRITITMSS